MDSFLYVIGLITACLSLTMGSVSLLAGLDKDGEKIDLLLRFMCLSLFVFFIIPPAGFIVLDKAPYPTAIIWKRLFNISYVAMFPWLIYRYNGYKRKLPPLVMDLLISAAYLVVFFTTTDSMSPFLFFLVPISVGMILIKSLPAIQYPYNLGKRKKANCLILIMAIRSTEKMVTRLSQ